MKRILVIAFVLLAVLSSGASACPLCGTETGAQVRALAFGPDFLRHLAATLAPVPILLALVAGTGLLDRSTATKERSTDAA
jgi:hypothetical protein